MDNDELFISSLNDDELDDLLEALEEIYEGNFYHVCTEGLEMEVIMRCDEDFIVARNYLALSAWKRNVYICFSTVIMLY